MSTNELHERIYTPYGLRRLRDRQQRRQASWVRRLGRWLVRRVRIWPGRHG